MKKKLSAITLRTAVAIPAIWPRRMAMNRTPTPVAGVTSSSSATRPVAIATDATIWAASAAILAASMRCGPPAPIALKFSVGPASVRRRLAGLRDALDQVGGPDVAGIGL